jgi:hypothetical protein
LGKILHPTLHPTLHCDAFWCILNTLSQS